MNKKALIDYVSKELVLSKADSDIVINTVFEGIMMGVRDDGEAMLKGFGTFKITHKKARTGRNPQDGTELFIEAKDVVTFKASKFSRGNAKLWFNEGN